MAEALYRKYRPFNLDDVVGQDIVVKTLKKAFRSDKVAHAYLLSGPRGIGKTSIAKIIAKTVNCLEYPAEEPCDKCKNCKRNVNKQSSDIIEIDAASNNGVDEIRELRGNVNFLPSSLKYKVYIIDEVHMLSTGAFNALLKTLEEPPSHVIFILATTEIHKIPETVISRCQCFNLKKVSNEAILKRLKHISKKEEIDCEDDVIKAIARLSNGGMRDAINMLEQLVSFSEDKIKKEDVYLLNGIIDPKRTVSLIEAVINQNISEIVEKVSVFQAEGKNIYKLTEEIVLSLRDLLILKLGNSSLPNTNFKKEFIEKVEVDLIYDAITILNDGLVKIKFSDFPNIILEVILLKVATIKSPSKSISQDLQEAVKVEKSISREINSSKKVVIEAKKDISQDLQEPIKEDKSISREIINTKKIIIEEEKDISQDLKEPENKERNISHEIINVEFVIEDQEKFEEFKNQRIKNIFSNAAKEELREVKKSWKKLEKYSMDEKYGNICNLVLDSELKVASDWGVIISCIYPSMVERINNHLIVTEKIFNKIFDKKLKVIAVTSNEWDSLKKEYIKNKDKKSDNYKFIKEEIKLTDIIKENKKGNISPLIKETLDKINAEIVEIN